METFAPFVVGVVLLLAALGVGTRFLSAVIGPMKFRRLFRFLRGLARITAGLMSFLWKTARWLLTRRFGPPGRVRRMPTVSTIRLRAKHR